MTPYFSIVLATYNAARTLERCLDSIDAQGFRGWELLVPDGGSTDATREILARRAGGIAWQDSTPDAGIYDAWNRAIPRATGRYLMFLGADDRLHDRDVLQALHDASRDREWDLVTGRGVLVGEDDVDYHLFGRPWDYGRLRRRITICHPGALHHRRLFERHGLFDPAFRICGDYDFLLRLPPTTEALHVDRPLVRVGDAGVSRQRRRQVLRETFRAQARSRVGPVMAAANYLDKLWRIPVARLLGIPN